MKLATNRRRRSTLSGRALQKLKKIHSVVKKCLIRKLSMFELVIFKLREEKIMTLPSYRRTQT